MLDAARLWSLLGHPNGPPRAPAITWGTETRRGNAICQDFTFGNGRVPGLFLRPPGRGRHPAVLYCHAHGKCYAVGADELRDGRPALQAPYGPALLDHGIACLAIDLAPFGARQSDGPETALAKAAHWQGRSLMGDMLCDLSHALDHLRARAEIDSARIATLGLSMGATHAYWLAALRPEIVATAHLCAFADIAPLIAAGAHDLHGPYMTVPGLLEHGDMGDVAALVAPRPHLICAGARDPLTPPAALAPALARLRAAYGHDGSLQVITDPDTGHVETAAMRRAVLEFLARHLHG